MNSAEHRNVTIREFRVGDEEELWQVFFTAVRLVASRNYTAEQVHAWAPEHCDVAAWTARVRQIRPFVAQLDGRIVGYADVQPDGYIDHFFVAAEFTRQGIGTALMDQLRETALSRKTPHLYSNVSITAKPFFERSGFRVEGAQTVALRGVTFQNYRMTLPLLNEASP